MPIKTAILGYGRSGSTLHADAIGKLPEFELTAVCDIDENARNKAYDRFKCNLYEDYKEMLKKEDLDLVVIVTRSHQHCRMACDCLKAGKNVLVTKPWALNIDEAEEMIKTSKESGKMLLPWLPSRWGGDLLRLRELIQSGIIGKVFQVRRSEYSFGIRHDWQTLNECGGGYLLNWGPHIVDQPLQLLGTPVKSVYGEMRQIINPGDVEDVFYAVIKTVDDVIVVTEYNLAANKLPNWVIQGDKGTIFVKDTEIEIHTAVTENSADINISNNTKAYSTAGKLEVIKDDVKISNRFGDASKIYPHIAKAIHKEESYGISLDSALNLTHVLDAIRRSSQTGQVVFL